MISTLRVSCRSSVWHNNLTHQLSEPCLHACRPYSGIKRWAPSHFGLIYNRLDGLLYVQPVAHTNRWHVCQWLWPWPPKAWAQSRAGGCIVLVTLGSMNSNQLAARATRTVSPSVRGCFRSENSYAPCCHRLPGGILQRNTTQASLYCCACYIPC